MGIPISQLVRLGFCTAILVAAESALVHGQDNTPVKPAAQKSPVVDRARDYIEAVMEHHVDPPTRQQLVLEVLRGLAEAASQRLPRDLSTRVSGTSDIDALYTLMDEECENLRLSEHPSEKIEDAVLRRMHHVVPGGVQVILQRDYHVNEQLAANRYVGIGVQVRMDTATERLQFMTIIEGGTAEAAGLKADDVVENVDGKDTFQVPLEDVVQWLRGPEESIVRLTVRTPGAESREIEIVRRVVPMKTLNLIEHGSDPAAALIRLDRLSSSTVHELRKIIEELPESSSTVIVDLRFCMDGSLHHLQLFADSLLEECRLGGLETRTGVRPLVAQAGTVLEGRKAVLVYRPGRSDQIDWLAAVALENGVSVYRDGFSFPDQEEEAAALPQTIIEFVPSNGGTEYIGLFTARLLNSDGRLCDDERPAGIPVGPPAATIRMPAWLSRLAGTSGESPTSPKPVPDQITHMKTQVREPLPPGKHMRKAPEGDSALIDQIMSNTNEE